MRVITLGVLGLVSFKFDFSVFDLRIDWLVYGEKWTCGQKLD